MLDSYVTYDGCACKPSMGIELIPAGADPRTWQLADAGIHAADYDRSCQRDTDCVAVVDGDLNWPCFCPSASIASSAVDAYQADLVRRRQGGIFGATCSCPTYGFPVCHQGLCTESLSIVTRLDGGVGSNADAGDSAARDASADGGL